MTVNSLIVLAAFIALCLGGGSLIGFSTMPETAGWFGTVVKPRFNPPSWVFGPVWSVLYILMAVAAWLVWRNGGLAQWAMVLFAVQLLFNFAWSLIFFRAHQIGWALVDITALWLALAATIFSFAQNTALAAWLLAPYLAWVSFAAVLNAAIWRLN